MCVPKLRTPPKRWVMCASLTSLRHVTILLLISPQNRQQTKWAITQPNNYDLIFSCFVVHCNNHTLSCPTTSQPIHPFIYLMMILLFFVLSLESVWKFGLNTRKYSFQTFHQFTLNCNLLFYSSLRRRFAYSWIRIWIWVKFGFYDRRIVVETVCRWLAIALDVVFFTIKGLKTKLYNFEWSDQVDCSANKYKLTYIHTSMCIHTLCYLSLWKSVSLWSTNYKHTYLKFQWWKLIFNYTIMYLLPICLTDWPTDWMKPISDVLHFDRSNYDQCFGLMSKAKWWWFVHVEP